MDNLTENGMLALNSIITAQNEIDVFNILDTYKIDSAEGYILLNVFHEANSNRQKAIKANKNATYRLKIKRLKEKYDYMQKLSDIEILAYYGHLIYEEDKSKKHPMWTYFHNDGVKEKCARNRKLARMMHSKKKSAVNCLKCEQLIECNCQ